MIRSASSAEKIVGGDGEAGIVLGSKFPDFTDFLPDGMVEGGAGNALGLGRGWKKLGRGVAGSRVGYVGSEESNPGLIEDCPRQSHPDMR